jgi:hypothetical protein
MDGDMDELPEGATGKRAVRSVIHMMLQP